jgi:hypothetical protein
LKKGEYKKGLSVFRKETTFVPSLTDRILKGTTVGESAEYDKRANAYYCLVEWDCPGLRKSVEKINLARLEIIKNEAARC